MIHTDDGGEHILRTKNLEKRSLFEGGFILRSEDCSGTSCGLNRVPIRRDGEGSRVIESELFAYERCETYLELMAEAVP